MTDKKIRILVAGASSQLGTMITTHCMEQSNLIVNILMKNRDELKDLCAVVEGAGGMVYEGDITQPDSIMNVTQNIHTVICCLNGSDELVINGQKNLLEDGERNGIQRFIASDYCVDYRNIAIGEHPFIDQRKTFREILAQSDVDKVHVFTGVFLEQFFGGLCGFSRSKGVVTFSTWGSPNTKFDVTTYDDTAKFVALIANCPDAHGDYEIIGNEVSINEVACIYEDLRGISTEVKVLGLVEDLARKRDQFKRDCAEEYPYNFLAYALPIFDGRGKLKSAVHRSFWIQPTTIKTYLKIRPDL